MASRDGEGRFGVLVQYGVSAKQKRAFAGFFRLQRALIDHKPRSKPDCCLSLGIFLFPVSFPPLRPCFLVKPIVQKTR